MSQNQKEPQKQLKYLIEKYQSQHQEPAFSPSPRSQISEALSNQVEVDSECDDHLYQFEEIEDYKTDYDFSNLSLLKVTKI